MILSKLIKNNLEVLLLIIIFTLGISIRLYSIFPSNIIIGFDQARDLFIASNIVDKFDLAIIGPTAGNNPNLHHGVLFYYYMIPSILFFGKNPIGVAFLNSVVNASTSILLYYFAKDLFKSKIAGFWGAFICAVSYQFVEYSGWISNPTPTLFTAPFYFYLIWKFLNGKSNYLKWASLILGITIQFELFFIYLIPITILLLIFFRVKLPNIKELFFSFLLFCLATSTMIATEIKFKFGGIWAILSAGNLVGGEKKYSLFENFKIYLSKWESFTLNLLPTQENLAGILGFSILLIFISEAIFSKTNRKRNIFLLLFYFSPLIMLFLGVHNAPWFLIGRPSAAILMASYVLTKIKTRFVIAPVLTILFLSNISAINKSKTFGPVLLEPDHGAILSSQLKAIEYTYNQSKGEPFSINTVTNPLYINAVWGYHYPWYGGENYGFLPSFSGGDQLHPYNTLSNDNSKSKYLYLIFDTTHRIPPVYTHNAIKWADERSILAEEVIFGGIKVQKRIVLESL